MPRRTNVFQEVVAIIHRHMAGDASVEESGMLQNAVTGAEREVDVVIRSRVAGHEVIVGVEATAKGRKADAPWVEGMVGKHADLPTSKLVLVSEAGFSEPARRLAVAKGAVPLAPADLEAQDPDYAILRALRSLWPKQVTVTAQDAQFRVRMSDGNIRNVRNVPMTAMLYRDDKTLVGTLRDAFLSWAELGGLEILVGHMATFSEDTDKVFLVRFDELAIVEDGREKRLGIYRETDDELDLIEKGQVGGHAAIRIGEIPLQHQRLGEVSFAHGEGRLGSHRALAVVTKNRITLRLRLDPEQSQREQGP